MDLKKKIKISIKKKRGLLFEIKNEEEEGGGGLGKLKSEELTGELELLGLDIEKVAGAHFVK